MFHVEQPENPNDNDSHLGFFIIFSLPPKWEPFSFDFFKFLARGRQ